MQLYRHSQPFIRALERTANRKAIYVGRHLQPTAYFQLSLKNPEWAIVLPSSVISA